MQKWTVIHEYEYYSSSDFSKIKDVHVELKKNTTNFPSSCLFILILMITSICMAFFSIFGLAIGVGLFALWKCFDRHTEGRIEKNIHIIFYTLIIGEDKQYFGYDMDSKEILYVSRTFATDSDGIGDVEYTFQPITLDYLKRYLYKYSKETYNIIKNLEQKDITMLATLQFDILGQ